MTIRMIVGAIVIIAPLGMMTATSTHASRKPQAVEIVNANNAQQTTFAQGILKERYAQHKKKAKKKKGHCAPVPDDVDLPDEAIDECD